MERMIGLMAAVALLGGCGSSSAPAPQGAIPGSTGAAKLRNPGDEQLLALNDLDRTIGLKRAIYDSKLTCRRMLRSGHGVGYKNLSLWVAECSEAKSYGIFISPDGSAQVRPCADLKELKLPECKIIDHEVVDKQAAGTKPAA